MSIKEYSIWGEEDYDWFELNLTCLLPYGFVVELTVKGDATIKSIKKDLLSEIEKQPFANVLSLFHQLTLECINENAENVELTDDKKRIQDVQPFLNVLKVKQCTQQMPSEAEQDFNNKLGILIGRNVEELEDMQDEEVVQFRRKMRSLCYDIQTANDKQNWLDKVMRLYPPDINFHDLPSELKDRFKQNKKITITVFITLQDQTFSSKMEVDYDSEPEKLVEHVCSKLKTPRINPVLHLLKVSGYQEYIIGKDVKLYQFTHIRKALIRDLHPELSLVTKNSVFIPPPNDMVTPVSSLFPSPPVDKLNVFDFKQPFMFTICSVSNVLNANFSNVLFRACIYQGGEAMCDVVVFKEKVLVEGKATFQETISLKISLQNIPRMARLCLLLYSHVKTPNKKNDGVAKTVKKKDMRPLAWLNIPMYDYQGKLRHGSLQCNMWPVTQQDEQLNDQLLNPIGTVESRPDGEDAINVHLIFNQKCPQPVYFPSFPDVLAIAAEEMETSGHSAMPVGREHLVELEKRLKIDPFDVLAEQDKELIWSLRQECREHFKESLETLLNCVKWFDYREVAVMQSLLQIWSPMEPTHALELLDFQYADASVRSFAVRCLESLSDSEVCLYLLQLVQVLKYESYLDTDLIRFLLKRALNNRKIGHSFFWLLRSEMHVPSVSVRFSLFLEAYCRGSPHLLDDLSKIVEALNNLRQLNDHIKVCGLASDKLKEEVRKGLGKKYKEVLSQLCCPINPSIKLQTLKIDRCKCMDSKMKPLWLVWQNVEEFGNDMLLMFKKGDDLRQDMLTLQILKIMDDIWQKNGLDLRMNVYNVLPTSQKEGLIEVVTDSRTQADVQMSYADLKVTASFNSKCIYQWLEAENPNEADFEKAMEVFMLSCAGYSVATYVLGVADRHSDNIMIKKNGQLFHIDFGHILGNFKSKFGVKRERCPFVLTTDYVYVIKRGEKNKNEFKKFESLCERAFMILRDHSKFLITLFLMMMNTGIPEVSCFKDIEYLKETLVPHKTEQEARQHFKTKFTQALRDSWKTSMNHMFHNLKKAKA